MTVRDLARHYFRFWTAPGQLADNAPAIMRTWIRSLPAHLDLETIYLAFRLLASTGQLALPEQAGMATWLAARPGTYPIMDEILSSKRPPKTYAELLERTYKTAQADIVDTVRGWLKQQLTESK